MGYPISTLETRALIKPGLFAVIPPTGLVNNAIFGIDLCKVSIVASPKMGAGFVQYIVDVAPSGGTTAPFSKEEDIECFLYCIEGNGTVTVGETKEVLTTGSYVYSPPGVGLEFYNTSKSSMKVLIYKQRYTPLVGYFSEIIFGNSQNVAYRIFDDMENVHIKDLLPSDLGFDMNMHILSFEPGGCHPFIETHVQEHGAFVLSGEGLYLLDNQWMPIKKDDFIWFGPYVTQGAYGVGRDAFTYIYSKDCNRDIKL